VLLVMLLAVLLVVQMRAVRGALRPSQMASRTA
jgi:hypothetical protein